MSPERDLGDEMKRFGLDDDTADRLLSGQIAPQDAPPGFQAIAQAVQAARASTPVDAGQESATVAAIVEALHSDPQSSTPVRRKRMLAQLLSAKVAAIAAVTVLGATAAAAATSTLPAPAQTAVSDAASHVGLSIPKPNGHASSHAATHPAKPATPGNGVAVGPDATGNAKSGLCTAYAAGSAATNAHSRKNKSVAFTNLQTAADAAGMSVVDYCKVVTPPSTDTTTSTMPESDATPAPQSHGKSPVSTPSGPPESTPVGPPASTPVGPPVSTPVSGPPVSTPVGPPVSTPVGPPASTPGSSHRP